MVEAVSHMKMDLFRFYRFFLLSRTRLFGDSTWYIFGVVCVAHLFVFSVLCLFYVFVLFLVPILSVSLDFPFLIVPSVFHNFIYYRLTCGIDNGPYIPALPVE